MGNKPKRKHSRFYTVVASICACFVMAAAAAAVIKAAAAQEGVFEHVKPPIPAPPVVFFDADGVEQSLQAYKGKAVLVHFWATWCAPCIVELPEMRNALARYAGQDVVLLPLSLDREPGTVDLFFKEKGLDFPVLIDRKGAAMRAFGVKGLPSTVLINRQGEVIALRNGVLNWDGMFTRALIADALQTPPKPAPIQRQGHKDAAPSPHE